MEKLTELRSYRVDLVCEECEEGYMIHTGGLPADFPPLFLHQCSACHRLQRLDCIYPQFRDRDVEVADSHHQKQTKEEADETTKVPNYALREGATSPGSVGRV